MSEVTQTWLRTYIQWYKVWFNGSHLLAKCALINWQKMFKNYEKQTVELFLLLQVSKFFIQLILNAQINICETKFLVRKSYNLNINPILQKI
jgi:hypothetical protein